MNIIDTTPELTSLLSGADHIDVKTAESDASLREFVAGTLSWEPGWVRTLIRARSVLARLLRLRNPDIPLGESLRPEDISFTPGDKIGFSPVVAAAEGRYIVVGGTDTHLTVSLAILTAPSADGPAWFEVVTVVKYHRWTGPLYFNIIRPFHHLVVTGMTNAGARA